MSCTVVENAIDTANDLNHNLDLNKKWAHQWRMSFNPNPQKQAVEVLFSRKNIATDHPEIRFNNTPVMKANEHKRSGIIINSKLLTHVNTAMSKARRDIGVLKLLSRYLPRSSLSEMYKLHIRPHLDYDDVLYHIPTKICEFRSSNTLPSIMEKIESFQYSAALAVTGAWRGTSRERLYEELGWESFDSRRWARQLTLFYKIVNKLIPAHMSNPIPLLQQAQYSFRRRDVIGQIRARTERFKSSFYPHCLKEWSTLSPQIRNTSSVDAFNKYMVSFVRPNAKSVFGIYDPTGLPYLTQLRTGLSK